MKRRNKLISLMLCLAMCLGALTALSACSSCGKTEKPDALVIMTEELDGLFNPFYSTTGADGTIVSMTQLSMLTTDYQNGEVKIVAGDDYAVVVKDYAIEHDSAANETAYTFVIKKGIKFSDGKPLTINDVMFNLYVYLDPVYTGSSTMYSTDIIGLQAYRTQQNTSGDTDSDSLITSAATTMAKDRIKELVNLYLAQGDPDKNGSYSLPYNQMVEAINAHSLSSGYKAAISNNPNEVTNAQLLADYELARTLFREELESDYVSAKESYLEDPYKSTGQFDEVTSFMYHEGYVELKYAKDPVTNKDIKSQITEVIRNYSTDVVKDKASAIEFVYNDKIESELHMILQYWATAGELETEFRAKATEVYLHKNLTDGELVYKNISGIVSLGHTTDEATVSMNGNTYTVAHNHNTDGTPVNAEEYDVLRIRIKGVDPKAIYNFAFAVAPQHYYAEGNEIDIANNKFGVKYGSFDFMKNEIQSSRNVKVPMGAGPYVATNIDNGDNPDGTAFYSNNVVYFKANQNFIMGAPKIEKLRYQVVSASNALNALETGSVHFVTPQLTQDNIDKINSLADQGIQSMQTDQLGYGYIGVNAGKIPDINLRRAIMTAMDTSLALLYYQTGTAKTIFFPMSTVSWAYPKNADGSLKQVNDAGYGYPAVSFNRETAKQKILDYMAAANVSAGDSDLSIKFTIAGSNLTDHPTYQTFQSAADLLNECGWDIEVVPDTQALTKLSSGSLSVWAAAWGSTIDPDMYQVYHKNSTATSTLAWGYREILANPSAYPEETEILNNLSDLIDQARETEDQSIRTGLYEQAMNEVLKLAVELPVYQRSVLYAYNSNVIKTESLPSEINPYSTPLDHIWEIEFAE